MENNYTYNTVNAFSKNIFNGISLIAGKEDLDKMLSPVICNHCKEVYDLTKAKINHRFQDCDQFTTPCCNYKFADTRTWKSFPDFTNIKKC